MNFYPKLSAIIAGTATVAALVQPQPVLAEKTAAEIRKIAEAITVRIDGPGKEQNNGSGTIVNRQGNVYTVLTNWHVIDAPGRYTIQTSDGRQHIADLTNPRESEQIPGADLAILQFSSEEDYRVAKKGNSDEMTGSSTLYAAGWLNPGPVVTERIFDSSPGRFVNRQTPTEDGYALLYVLEIAQPGMSGGPVLNDEGRLVGINGLAQVDLRTGKVDLVAGIPIEIFESWLEASSLGSPSVGLTSATLACDIDPGIDPKAFTRPSRGSVSLTPFPAELGLRSVRPRCEKQNGITVLSR